MAVDDDTATRRLMNDDDVGDTADDEKIPGQRAGQCANGSRLHPAGRRQQKHHCRHAGDHIAEQEPRYKQRPLRIPVKPIGGEGLHHVGG
jgi:hypothetical protein